MSKKDIISKLANFLVDNGDHMSGGEVVKYLNRNGYQTTSGGEYKDTGRGIFKVIRDTYHSLKKEGRDEDAENVAKAFTKDNDDYAY